MVERALAFYLEHSEVVDQYSEPLGQTHRVYSCPACESPSVIRDGEMVGLFSSPRSSAEDNDSGSETSDPEALVTC
mgnify:CR=1 FL=1